MEHRSGLIVKTMVTPADGYGERDAALVMVERVPGRHRITVAADKGYDTRDFVAGLRAMDVDAARRADTRRAAAAPSMARTTRHPGYAISQQKRKLVEQGFGWMKTIGGLRKLRHRGGPLVDLDLHLHRGGVQHRAAAPTAGGDRHDRRRAGDESASAVDGAPRVARHEENVTMEVTISAAC